MRSDNSLGSRAAQVACVARFGVQQFLAENPPRVFAATMAPRFVLQCLFFTLLGRVVGGPDHAAFAFTGAVAAVASMAGATMVSDVPVTDKYSGTFARIRTGTMGTVPVLALRALPYPVAGFACAVLALILVAPATGHLGLAADLAPLLPLLLLIAITATAMGLAAAVLALGKRADVIAGNAAIALILVAGGVFFPPERLALLDIVGHLIPVRHGLSAIRAALDGQPWLQHALLEAVVGLGWAAVAGVVVVAQVRRASQQGHDDFE